MFYGAFDSDEGWSFDRRPITDADNEAVVAEILVEHSRGVFRGKVGQDDIYEGAHVYRFGVVPGQIICVRWRASSINCRTAGVLKPVWDRGQHFHVRMKNVPRVNFQLLRPRS